MYQALFLLPPSHHAWEQSTKFCNSSVVVSIVAQAYNPYLNFCQRVPALSGGAVMDSASHPTGVVMGAKTALMEVMN